jgi:hypothetical protein
MTVFFLAVVLHVVLATDMRSMVIGQAEEAHHRQNRDTTVGTVCRPPGGIVNLDGECLCCGGWGGPGCATRNKCHEVSCANGGTCDQTTGFCQCPKAFTGHQCEVIRLPNDRGYAAVVWETKKSVSIFLLKTLL